jgi:hypothetical protein
MVAVGDSLTSGRYYTQTSIPAYRTLVGVDDGATGIPNVFVLRDNYHNTLGQQVAILIQGENEAGYHEVRFNATGLSSGVYFYRFHAGDFVQTRKLLLVR